MIFWGILGIVYLLSPIPLLVLFIMKNNEAKNILDLYRKEQQKNSKLEKELKAAELNNTSVTSEAKAVSVTSTPPKKFDENKLSALSAPVPVKTAVQSSKEVKHKHDKKLKDLIDTSNTGLVLTIGVILLLLASVGFMSATWSILSTGIRALFLLSFSAIFLAAGIFAKAKLDLPSTSLAFYSIGSAALPITIIGASAFELLGKSFGINGTTGHYTFAIAFISLMLLTMFGAAFFKSRVFAFTSLACITSVIISLVTIREWPYNLDVLFFVLSATAVTVIAPFMKGVTQNTSLSSIGAIAEPFAIFNHYALTVCALAYSEQGIISGIFIILLGVGFLIGSFYNTKYNLLSLPHILLILLGSRQLLNNSSDVAVAAWWLIVGIYFVTLSFVKLIKRPLSQVLFVTGLVMTFLSTLPMCLNVMIDDFTWLFIPQILIAMVVFILCGLYKKKNFYSLPVVILFEIMIWCISYGTDMDFDFIFFIINLAVFALFAIIKNNPLYFSGSEFLLGLSTVLSLLIQMINNSLGLLGESFILIIILTAMPVFYQYLCQHKDNWLKYVYSILWVLIPSVIFLIVNDNSDVFIAATLLITSILYSVFTIGHYCNNKKNIIISRFAGVSMVYINALIAADISDKLSILLLITITVIPLLLSSYLLFKETKINGYMSRKAAWLTGLALSTLPTFPCLLIYIFNDGAVNTNLSNDIAFPYALTALAETIILFILQILKTNTETRTTFIKDNFKGIQAGILVSSFIHSPSIIILREHFRYSESNLELFTVILLISLMTLWALLYRYELRIISVIATVYASYAFVNWFRFEYRSPMLLIPILLFSISVACDRKHSVNKASIFYGILAVSASMLFLDSKTNIYALAAFIITEITYFIRSNSKKDKTRAISLLAVTLSAVVWFKLPFSPYAGITDIVQLKLLPPTLFFILLPFIITQLNERRELSIRIRIIYGYILMAVLAGIAIDSGKISDRLIYAVICVVILVAGFFFHSRQTVVLGTVSTVFLIVYLIGQVFGSRAWLIYLAVSGTVLISVAVRNEIKRRKS